MQIKMQKDLPKIGSNYAYSRSRSITGCKWIIAQRNERVVELFCQTLGIGYNLACMLQNRKLTLVDEVNDFLVPDLEDIMPDPLLLTDMDAALRYTYDAIKKGQKIVLFGDYDVDGASSIALLQKFFSAINVDVGIYIPHRMTDGYGPTIGAMNFIAEDGAKLLIIVDCGSVAFEAVDFAMSTGMNVIILDHHLLHDKLPKSSAFINPQRVDNLFPYKSIAATTVAFLFVVALDRFLKNSGCIEKYSNKNFTVNSLLSLVALATICDVMILHRLNRALVMKGMEYINAGANIGISMILESLSILEDAQPYHLGYTIGPRINAPGRLDHGSTSVRLLATDDIHEARELASKLNDINQERKIIEDLTMSQAIEYINKNRLQDESHIVAIGDDWHIGVLGIIASRVRERYRKPAIVLSRIAGKKIKGSGRSVHGIDLGGAFAEATSMDILIEGGGHPMAGGFMLYDTKFDEFTEFLKNRIESEYKNSNIFRKAHEIAIDLILNISGCTRELIDDISRLAPFGYENPEPCFLITSARVLYVRIKINYLYMIVVDANDISNQNTIKCIGFKSQGSAIENFCKTLNVGDVIDIVGSLQKSSQYPDKVEIVIHDIGYFGGIN